MTFEEALMLKPEGWDLTLREKAFCWEAILGVPPKPYPQIYNTYAEGNTPTEALYLACIETIEKIKKSSLGL